jgi:hypothetical protein
MSESTPADCEPVAPRDYGEERGSRDAWREYVSQTNGLERMDVDLYEGKAPAANVRIYTVRLVRSGLYRVVLLLRADNPNVNYLHGMEGSRDDAARWLRGFGVPVLSIHPPRN